MEENKSIESSEEKGLKNKKVRNAVLIAAGAIILALIILLLIKAFGKKDFDGCLIQIVVENTDSSGQYTITKDNPTASVSIRLVESAPKKYLNMPVSELVSSVVWDFDGTSGTSLSIKDITPDMDGKIVVCTATDILGNSVDTGKKIKIAYKAEEASEPAPEPAASVEEHVHEWEPVTKTVHHDAVYEEKWVVDTPAWDEPHREERTRTETTTETHSYYKCECGATFETDQMTPDLREMHSGTDPGPESTIIVHNLQQVTDTKEVTKEVPEIVEWTEHHDEVGHTEKVEKTKAYDEEVITGYKCTGCDETRETLTDEEKEHLVDTGDTAGKKNN